MERLQKYLSACGVASRRKSEELILAGKVKVNGKVVKELGIKVSDNDDIEVNGVFVKKEEKEYYILNKPEKVICSVSDDKGRLTVIDFIDTKEKIFPVGRLDYDTTGLILLTNDGEITNKLTHPSGTIEKTYYVKADGIMNIDEIRQLEKGILLDGVMTKKAKAKLRKIDKRNRKSYVEITITEGRNHQVKNMFAALNHKVLKLKRTKYAFFNLEELNLSLGEARKLTIKEVKRLYNYAKENN